MLLAFGGLEEVECSEGSGGLGRWRSCRENKTASAVEEPIGDGLGACDVAAGDAEGFAEGSHVELDAVGEVELSGEASALGAEDADGVGFVQEEDCVVVVFEFDDFVEGSEVAVHAEDGFGDDEEECVGMVFLSPFEELAQAAGIVVREDAEGSAAEAGGINEAGVGEFVEEDDVGGFCDGGENACGGLPACGEDEGGLSLFKLGNCGFELGVRGEGSREEAGGCGSCAVG